VTALKAGLFVLLAANTLYFVIAESASKGIDSAAWFILLILFAAETTYATRISSSPPARRALRSVRLIAAGGVIAATAGYFFEENVLDAVNASLWILVVLLLEVELRRPAMVASLPRLFKASAAAAFGGLALLVAIWALLGMWLDAYDAALWLLAFGLIEIDVTKRYPVAAVSVSS
jgi:hypothetical protein